MTTTKLLTIPGFANAIGVSENLARAIVKRGEVPSIQVGRRRRVDSRWVEKWTAQANPPIPQGLRTEMAP
jgi:excisionase family DNA binding protein